jgi:2-polyprenyl-3-methyl-5-hydroxy-6-metoxy-1,4-benzoquinol methylase
LDDVALAVATDITRCRGCGSLFRDPHPLKDQERRYASWHYDSTRVDDLRRRMVADLRRDERHLNRFGVRPGARLIEIGSYVGALLDVATDAGCEIVGVDVNRELVEYARRRGHNVRQGSLECLEGLPDQLDGVWILNCFEQLADLDVVLCKARSLLRRGGHLVIRTPNARLVSALHRPHQPARLRSTLDANAVLGVPFRRCLSSRGITRLLQEHGFRVNEIHGREFSSRNPAGSTRARCGLRPLRVLAYGLASTITGEPMQPWLDILAATDDA